MPQVVSLTKFFGDPDMFMREGDERPTATNYTWSSTQSGAGTIRIPKPAKKYILGVQVRLFVYW